MDSKGIIERGIEMSDPRPKSGWVTGDEWILRSTDYY